MWAYKFQSQGHQLCVETLHMMVVMFLASLWMSVAVYKTLAGLRPAMGPGPSHGSNRQGC